MIVVTGANGLVGSAVVRRFFRDGQKVRGTIREGSQLDLLKQQGGDLDIREADVLDMPALLSALEGATVVIHCAALVSFNPRRRNKILEINTQGTRNVVNACIRLKIPRLIHVSSIAALGRNKGLTDVTEESIWVDGAGESDYAESKYLAELEVFRGMEEGLQVSVVNPSVIFCPGDGLRSSSRIFGYVWKERTFYADGLMNFVDMRDVVEIIVRLSQDIRNGERFIASAGAANLELIIREIAARFQKKPPSIKVPERWVSMAAMLESWRSRLTGEEPLISSQSVRFVQDRFIYRNDKAVKSLGINFQPLGETLDWCCREFRNDNINK